MVLSHIFANLFRDWKQLDSTFDLLPYHVILPLENVTVYWWEKKMQIMSLFDYENNFVDSQESPKYILRSDKQIWGKLLLLERNLPSMGGRWLAVSIQFDVDKNNSSHSEKTTIK